MGQCPAEMETSGLGLPKRSEEVLCSPHMYDGVWHIVACQVLFSILCQVLL